MSLTTADLHRLGYEVIAGRAVKRKAATPAAKSTGTRMNGTEASYAAHLALRMSAGEVAWWKFEAMKLRIGEGCTYTPDFIVRLASGRIEAHETKGWERDDAVVKFKVAAEQFPWITFRMFKREGEHWRETRTLNGGATVDEKGNC